MKLGSYVTTPAGNGVINRESMDSGTLLYRVAGVKGALGSEAWFQPKHLKAA